jgi:hypothetical protein
VALVGTAVMLSEFWSYQLALPRLLLLGGGLLLAAVAVVRRLRPWREQLEERIETAAVITLAGFTALVGILGIDHHTADGVVESATNTNPVVITTQDDHGLATGESISIAGVTGNTAVNGATFPVTVLSATKFSIPVAGNGPYTGGGSWVTEDWISAYRILMALVIVALTGLVLVLLPNLYRRVGISLLLLFHFFGIFTMVTYLAPPGPIPAPAPFLANQIWSHVYRNYLEFLCIDNAYHFYSPEPGPPTLLFFKLTYAPEGAHYKITSDTLASLNSELAVEGKSLEERTRLKDGLRKLQGKAFASGDEAAKALTEALDKESLEKFGDRVLDIAWNVKSKWVKFPNRQDSPVNLHYQRLLSVTESCNQMIQSVPPQIVAAKAALRGSAGRVFGIPMHPNESLQTQYQPMNTFSWSTAIPSAVRRIGLKHAHLADDPTAQLVSIKMYRVRHAIIPAAQLANGDNPLDKPYYYPFYLGEYYPDGQLVNFENDPFLFWMIPIYRDPNERDQAKNLRDYLEVHADLVYNRRYIEAGNKGAKP